MKLQAAAFSLLFLLLPLQAEIVLTGMIAIDGTEKATFKDTADGKQSSWLAQGSSFNGYVVKSIHTKDNSATLVRDGQELVVHLQAASVQKLSEQPGPQPSADLPSELSKLSDAELHSRGFHRIGRGESGARIARQLGVTLSELQRLNPEVKWARLEVGQIVRYRGPGAPPPSPAPAEAGKSRQP